MVIDINCLVNQTTTASVSIATAGWLTAHFWKKVPKAIDFLEKVCDTLIKMKHEGKTIEPRDIVKANAEIYRNNELIRMEKENYNRWLAVHNDEVTKKNHPDKNDFFNYEH